MPFRSGLWILAFNQEKYNLENIFLTAIVVNLLNNLKIMKKLLLIFLFGFTLISAQDLIDDNEITENRKEVGRQNISFDLDNPLESYRLKCENPIYAQFPSGDKSFKESLFGNMKGYVDGGLYFVNGTFDLIIYVNKSGDLDRFQLKPEVPNGGMLYRDLELALKKMNPKWIPATCNGVPIESRLRQKINFRTENFDI